MPQRQQESRTGVVVGLEVPLVALSAPHQLFPPPQSLAFSQLYIGHSWGR